MQTSITREFTPPTDWPLQGEWSYDDHARLPDNGFRYEVIERRKFQLYARAGVTEYWIVDPDERTVEVFLLRGDAYVPLGTFRVGEEVHSQVIAGFIAAINDICPV